jgi:hypothetical protein
MSRRRYAKLEAMHTLAIEVDDRTYAEICRQASLRGVPPEAVAAERVGRGVGPRDDSPEAVEEELAGLEEAMAEMEALTAGRPSVDVVATIREGRDELERRADRR